MAAFQRSFSRVWWGSDNQMPAAAGSSFTSGGFYAQFNQQQKLKQQQQQQERGRDEQQGQEARILGRGSRFGFDSNGNSNINSKPSGGGVGGGSLGRMSGLRAAAGDSKAAAVNGEDARSLDGHSYKSFNGNLSCIQEVEDEQNSTKLSWKKRDSPGSLRSQDSGFSDHDDTRCRPNGAADSPSSAKSEASQIGTPQSARSVATPPTVLRRVGNSSFYTPLVTVPQRLSFGASQASDDIERSRTELFAQFDSMQLSEPEAEAATTEKLDAAPKIRKQLKFDEELKAQVEQPKQCPTSPKLKRQKRVRRHKTANVRSSVYELDEDAMEYLPAAAYVANTSTPNAKQKPALAPTTAVQAWLTALRLDCAPEYMFTLQTKSITKEAYKRTTITPNHVTKLIRQLQQQAVALQADYERVERLMSDTRVPVGVQAALVSATKLLDAVGEYAKLLERRLIFCVESRSERQRFAQHIDQIKLLVKDTRYSLERQHYISLLSLLDDLRVLKRHLLIATRMIFERMMLVVVQSVEHAGCDLLLRANLNMLATLANIEYTGFASLADAFVQSGAVRALLTLLMDHKVSTLRAQALRALAAICCAPAAIAQFSQNGGVELLCDTLDVERTARHERIERREAVSLLTQITATWHGPEHRVIGLTDAVETIVAGIADLIEPDCCTQTLLLCAAALNNLSRLESTSHYSIMSNEIILRLIVAMEPFDESIPVFLYEQTTAMLHNMSLNKKCHGHLTSGVVINFIMTIYETELHRRYAARAENEAQKRTIKAILHALTALMADEAIGGGAGGTTPTPELDQVRELLRLDGLVGSHVHKTEQSLLRATGIRSGNQAAGAQVTPSQQIAAAEQETFI